MINALHLIWIIPLAMLAGVFCTALVAVNKEKTHATVFPRKKQEGK
jgi:hypothetical protein